VTVTEDIARGPGLVEAIPQGTSVTVLRPGGSIQVDGRTITAYVSDAYRLVASESYLLFETRVRETGAYRSTDHYGMFFVRNETVNSLASTPAIDGDLA
jgi:hypothetical protein